ncbi:MAG TPA: helix-turn-helix transcriptional regulator [Metalysinibacillus sp.]
MLRISLAAARVNADLRQEEAAEKAGITAKTLRNYERGITAIPATTLRKVAEIYGIPEECIKLPIVNDGGYDEGDFFLTHSAV